MATAALTTGSLVVAGTSAFSPPPASAVIPPNESLVRLTDDLEHVREVTVVGDLAFFSAHEPGQGTQLWVSDGTRDGTRSLTTGREERGGRLPEDLTSSDDLLFFTARSELSRQLWISDGTTEGTREVREIGFGDLEHTTAVGDRLFFQADDRIHGPEAWVSDGTTSGTTMLGDTRAGQQGSYPSDFTESGGRVFFAATDGDRGTELWATDGTEGGTALVSDISPLFGSYPMELADVDGTLYFQARQRFSVDRDYDAELWRSDGTDRGTRLVKDINPGGNSRPNTLTAVGDRLFFRAVENGSCGPCGQDELFVSDGTATGTQALLDRTDPDRNRKIPYRLLAFDGRLYFDYTDRLSNRGLWVSNGTREVTAPIALVDVSGATPVPIGQRFYFSGDGGVLGRELWASNGLPLGTWPVADVNPGPASSDPRELAALGDDLVFVADGPEQEGQLWVLREDTVAPDTRITAGPADPRRPFVARLGFEGAPTNDVTRYECSLNGSRFVECESPLVVRRLPNDTHRFRIRALDHLGLPDPTPATQSFVVARNNFVVRKRLGRIKRKGRVRVTLNLPGPGTLKARGARSPVSGKQVRISRKGRKSVVLRLTRRGNARIRRSRATSSGAGRLPARVRWTYTPDGGQPRSLTRRHVFKLS